MKSEHEKWLEEQKRLRAREHGYIVRRMQKAKESKLPSDENSPRTEESARWTENTDDDEYSE